jgi:hypothetical protein
MYATISHWTSTISRDSEAGKVNQKTAQEKYAPAVIAFGALHVYFIATSETTFDVVAIYPDEATAKAATEKQNAMRASVSQEMPISLTGHSSGEVYASA